MKTIQFFLHWVLIYLLTILTRTTESLLTHIYPSISKFLLLTHIHSLEKVTHRFILSLAHKQTHKHTYFKCPKNPISVILFILIVICSFLFRITSLYYFSSCKNTNGCWQRVFNIFRVGFSLNFTYVSVASTSSDRISKSSQFHSTT
jgi:hypothetical protein